MMTPWPFTQWGLDIMGLFLTALRQLKFLVVGINYFTKWVEAEALATIRRKIFETLYGGTSSTGTRYQGYLSPTMEDNSTTAHLEIFAHSWVLRITTHLQHIHRSTVKSKSRTGLCSRSSRPGSRGQRVSGPTSY